MTSLLLGLATAVTLLALFTHITIGTKQNAAPILDNRSLPEDPRRTLTFSWRANSILMLAMSIGFGSGFVMEDTLLVSFNGLLAGGLAVSAGFVALQEGVNPFKFPPMPLFLSISVFGICSQILK